MKLDKSVQITLIICAAVLILALAVYNLFASFNPSDTISVNGEATVSVVPDLVGIYFSVETIADTSEEATGANAEVVDAVKAALVSAGFEEDEITTQSFSVNENYDWDDGDREQNGYIATHRLKLEISTDETERIGRAIDSGVGAGAEISYINFELSQEKENEVKAEAIQLAAQDAKTKAEALATGIGKDLGKLVSVSTGNYNYYSVRAYGAVAVAEDTEEAKAATEITPSEQDVYASVSAVYKIK